MNAFVEVTVMEDNDQESTRAIRACDVYEIEDCETHRVIRRRGIDDLFVLDEMEMLQLRIQLRTKKCCKGCK